MSPPIETIEGLEELVARIDELLLASKNSEDRDGGKVFILFVGNHLPDSNDSWCPDCVKAQPVVGEAWDGANCPASVHLIKVFVGARDCWKDPNNRYRTDARFRLESIPTLIELRTGWEEVNRLERDEDFVSVATIKTLFAGGGCENTA